VADGSGTVTVLLRAWRDGDRDALDQLLPLVYDELHRIAGGFLRGERAGHTFRSTDLVHEAYLRLAGGPAPEWNDRVHFFAIAARGMRQILVDHARRRCAAKRGAGERAITFDEQLIGVDRPEEVLALDAALDALAAHDERKARVIELHYFGGMTQPEVADALAVHVNTVARDLRFAEAWIHKYMREAQG
jgi:RNA polymerase sigma-70 factor, ECF subfamily